jgi:hypothetical protein
MRSQFYSLTTFQASNIKCHIVAFYLFSFFYNRSYYFQSISLNLAVIIDRKEVKFKVFFNFVAS